MSQSATWLPYCGEAPLPGELLARWNFDPLLILAMLLVMAGCLWLAPMRSRERRMFAAGITLLAILFISPFCALTSALFSARAVHHLALTAIAAPLLAFALPARGIKGGIVAWTAIHAATFWSWHLPLLYETALANHIVYWLMQVSLLLTAFGFWRSVRGAPLPMAVAGLLATMVQMGLLGALLTFAGSPLYAPHAVGPLAWGLTPLDDQQLAGLIMWAPGAGLYLAAGLALASRWFAGERLASL